MNILFFLIPKSQVAYVESSFTIRQVAEKLDYHKYSVIPVLDEEGKFLDVISEGDLFWFVKKYYNMNYKSSEEINIMSVPKRRTYQAINCNASMDELLSLACSQNFVPVLDDNCVFIGIITRKAILGYFADKMHKE